MDDQKQRGWLDACVKAINSMPMRDIVPVVVLLLTMAIGYGKMDQRLSAVENSQSSIKQQSTEERRELKADIQRELQSMQITIQSMDSKLTALLFEQRRGQMQRDR